MKQFIIVQSPHEQIAVRSTSDKLQIIRYDRNPFNTKVFTFSKHQAAILAQLIMKEV